MTQHAWQRIKQVPMQDEQKKNWHYAMGSREIGPLSYTELRQLAHGGGIIRQTLIWKTGMENWVAAGRIQGLFDDVPLPAKPVSYAHSPTADETLEIKAQRVSLALFTLSIMAIVALAVAIVDKYATCGKRIFPRALLVVGWLGEILAAPAAVFTLVYVPWRWRVIKHQHFNYRFFTLIGGAGIVAAAVALAAHWLNIW